MLGASAGSVVQPDTMKKPDLKVLELFRMFTPSSLWSRGGC